jgi:HD-GYP domain-containing protein (c-di-GMP phosphodiesterase class II)
MTIERSTKAGIGEYLPIYLDSLRNDSVLEFDLYVKAGREMILYRSARLPFTQKTRGNLISNGVRTLYVSIESQRDYQRYIETNLPQIIADPEIKETVKAGIVYDSAKLLIREVFSRPNLGENIQRSKDMVESTVAFILTGQYAFHSMLQVMSFDYSTYTHSVNVCAFAVSLGRHLGIESPMSLHVLGTGALLHDVGKTRISEDILNKTDPLTSDEIDTIRKHPQWGYDIIKETNLISRESYYPILEHHERNDRSGYPHAMAGEEIHDYSKIVAIADVFDAMTTRRVYRPAVDAFPALKTMFSQRYAFDKKMLEAFTRLLGPSHLSKL